MIRTQFRRAWVEKTANGGSRRTGMKGRSVSPSVGLNKTTQPGVGS